jgi:hypothetical protein
VFDLPASVVLDGTSVKLLSSSAQAIRSWSDSIMVAAKTSPLAGCRGANE